MRPWDEDLEAKEWEKKRRNHVKRGNWKIITVAFEHKRAYVKLNRTEWDLLQKFIEAHTLTDLKVSDFDGYPTKVRHLLLDWLKTR